MKLFGLTLPFTATKRAVAVTNDSAFSGGSYVYLGEQMPVTPESALAFSAIFACVKIISETVASVPLNIYQRVGESEKKKASNLPLFKVLRTKPNNMKTSGVEFRQMLMAHVLLWGNGYAQILRNKAGEVLELHPLHPSRVKPDITEAGLVYKVRLKNGGEAILPPEDVFHLRGYRDSGLEGLSPISAAKQAIQMGLSLESFGTNFFEGGAFPAGVLEYDSGELSPEAKANLRESWQGLHGGANRGKKVAVLEAGLKWKPMGIPQADAQFLEQRRFQIEEIARIYRVPPHMLADLTKSSFSNIEQQGQEFVTYCLLPWFRMWEDAITRDFFDGDDREFFAEFLLDGLLRGDMTARSQAYTAGRQWGWLSANDIRAKENMNPIGPEGDVYLSPLNMVPAGQEGQEPVKEEPEVEDDTQEEDKVRAAFRGPLKEAWTRVIRKEAGTIKSAAKKKTSEEFEVWFEEFIDEHRSFAEGCLSEIFNGYAQLAGVGGDIKEPIEQYVSEIREGVAKWMRDPALGYERDESKIGGCWTERVLSYHQGEYATAS